MPPSRVRNNISVDDNATQMHHQKRGKELTDTSTITTGDSTNNGSNNGYSNLVGYYVPGNSTSCFPSINSISWSRRKQPKSDCKEKDARQEETQARGELMLAQELHKLSLKERGKVQNDIHAVSQEVPETMELDHEFQLQFLRADLWDVTEAAKRIIRHFESKLKLFGINKLAKRITWDDLDSIDQYNVQTGALQFFTNNCCERNGRPIFFTSYNLRRNFHHNRQQQREQRQTSEEASGLLPFQPTQLEATGRHQNEQESNDLLSVKRVYWYTIMSGIQQSIEAQRKGGVIVAFMMGTTAAEFYNAIMMDTTHMIIGSIPIRTVGAHMCLTDRILLPLFSALMAAGPKQMRLRTRIHFGSHMEVQYVLNTFGLDSCSFPVDEDGNLKT